MDQRRADELRELRGGKSGVEIATEMLEAMAAAREANSVPRPYPADEHVLSCPGCNAWQLHYTDAVMSQWMERRIVGGTIYGDYRVFDHMVEAILKEHVAADCTQPMLFFAIAKDRGVL